jgi:hypothetical protein
VARSSPPAGSSNFDTVSIATAFLGSWPNISLLQAGGVQYDCLSYRPTNKLLNKRAAKVLDSFLLFGRKAKLIEEAANLTSSNAFDAVD